MIMMMSGIQFRFYLFRMFDLVVVMLVINLYSSDMKRYKRTHTHAWLLLFQLRSRLSSLWLFSLVINLVVVIAAAFVFFLLHSPRVSSKFL